jgi:hypothetical protein
VSVTLFTKCCMISTNCMHYVTYKMEYDVTQHQFLEEPAASIMTHFYPGAEGRRFL